MCVWGGVKRFLNIKRYLHHFVLWWQKTAEIWRYEELLYSFIRASWDINPAAIAAGFYFKNGLHY